MIRNIHHAQQFHGLNSSAARPASVKTTQSTAETNSFRSLFDSGTQTPSPAAPTVTQPASTQIKATVTKSAANDVVLGTPAFEPAPVVANPDGSSSPLNYTQFADATTANQIAAKLGGTVVSVNTDGFSTGQRSISVPGSANLVNAGIAAQLFAQYGDKPGSLAWQVINRDLGRDPMAT